MQRARCRLLIVLAAAHLFLVTLGAAGVPLRDVGPIGRILQQYSALSGAGTGYGFFAPTARGKHVLTLHVVDAEGRRTTTFLETGGRREIELRLSQIAGELSVDDPELRRDLATSLAARTFARHPDAHDVVVRVDHFESVSMEEHRQGVRPQSPRVYEARFERPRRQTEGSHGDVDPG